MTQKPGFVLYFAYGSNMSVAQMASRCPESLFIGTATLPNYHWQINERGVANVVAQPGEDVEGLVYHVNASDEKELDGFEGVSINLYSREWIQVHLEPHRFFYGLKSSELAAIMRQKGRGGNEDADQEIAIPKTATDTPKEEDASALVYVSENFCQDGLIRTEYIKRMADAISDAARLGVATDSMEREIELSKHRKGPDGGRKTSLLSIVLSDNIASDDDNGDISPQPSKSSIDPE